MVLCDQRKLRIDDSIKGETNRHTGNKVLKTGEQTKVLTLSFIVYTTITTRLGSSVSNFTFRLKYLVLVFKLYVKSMCQISDL